MKTQSQKEMKQIQLIENFLIAKIAYLVSFIGYTISLFININKYDTIIDNVLKFLFGLLLFFITYFLKHYLDKKLKK